MLPTPARTVCRTSCSHGGVPESWLGWSRLLPNCAFQSRCESGGYNRAACGPRAQQWTHGWGSPTLQGLIDPPQQRSPQLCPCWLNDGHQWWVILLFFFFNFWINFLTPLSIFRIYKHSAIDLISVCLSCFLFFATLRLDDPSLPTSVCSFPSSSPPANPCYFHPAHIRRCIYPASDGRWLDS